MATAERNEHKIQFLRPEHRPKITSGQRPESEHADWIIDQLTLLAVGKGMAITPERFAANAADLIDLPREVLAQAFRRARQECDFYPQISEIRKFAGALQAQQDRTEPDRAWAWLIEEYLPRHGADGHDHVVAANDEETTLCRAGRCVDPNCRGGFVQASDGRARRCAHRGSVRVAAPQISARTLYALKVIGVGTKGGLQRILECAIEFQGILRKEFGEAYARAIDAERAGNLDDATRRVELPSSGEARAALKQLTEKTSIQ